jgi:DnaK suppressor protein
MASDQGEGSVTTTTRRKTSTTTGRTAASRNHVPSGGGARAVARFSADSVDPAELPVRPGEDPWTAAEVAEVHGELNADVQRLKDEIEAAEAALTGLMRDSNDGAGDDQVDAGTKNISREHELSLAANARDMLAQTERALLRMAGPQFGLCESCGKAIGKARVQAFPRATLCVECKQKQERR